MLFLQGKSKLSENFQKTCVSAIEPTEVFGRMLGSSASRSWLSKQNSLAFGDLHHESRRLFPSDVLSCFLVGVYAMKNATWTNDGEGNPVFTWKEPTQ